MGFDDNYTKFTPDLNVGISRLILGETTINSPNIIYGNDLIKILQGNNFWYKGDVIFDQYYPKEYDKSLFKYIPVLKFDTPDNSLTSIYCVINDAYKSAIIEELNNKYGYNRNGEWTAKGIYRTEVNNKYATIQINLWEFDNLIESDNLYGSKPPSVIKELTLEMHVVKLKMTKLQRDKEIQLQNKERQLENGKKEVDMKIKSAVNKAFDLD